MLEAGEIQRVSKTLPLLTKKLITEWKEQISSRKVLRIIKVMYHRIKATKTLYLIVAIRYFTKLQKDVSLHTLIGRKLLFPKLDVLFYTLLI